MNINKDRVWAHIEICRFDHWIKNVFVLPGIFIGLSYVTRFDVPLILLQCVIGLLSVGFIASSNYIINEVLDASFDQMHPKKKFRPVPSGRVNKSIAYMQWIVFMLIGLVLALLINYEFAMTMLALWVMGCLYNFPPIRMKDVPYLDVLSESVNNPLRLLAGYYIINPGYVPPVSLLLSYWMVGAYFMAIKRFAEYREIADPALAGAYRKSFYHYNEENLLTSISFYGSTSMLFLGAFIIRYRLEMILSFPCIALVMAMYLKIAFKKDSAVQLPEKLYRERGLLVACLVTGLLMLGLLFVNIPALYMLFKATLPVFPAVY